MRVVLAIAILACALSAQDRGDQEYGRFLKRGDTFYFESDDGRVVPLSNPEAVKPTLAMIPVAVRGKMDNRGYFEVLEVSRGRLLSRWEARPEIKVDAGLVQSFRRLLATYQRADQGEGRDNLKAYAEALSAVEADVATALREDRESRLYLDLARDVVSERKAIYDGRDLYFPHIYLGMYATSRSCVQIQQRSGSARGSGVLVGTDLVLTCRHCTYEDKMETTRYAPKELRVVCGYEKGADGKSLPERVYPVQEYVVTGAAVDYCLLRIRKEKDELPPQTAVKALSRAKASLDRAIYVVGHPEGGPRTISDDAIVLFPFEATDGVLTKIWMRLLVRYEHSRETADKLFKEIKKNYVPQGGGTYRYLRQKDRKHPSIGADCDTFSGNSGSGAYTKSTHDLIGILYAGQKDRTELYRPGWRRHERIAPAIAILEDMRKQGKDPKALGITDD